ncbi:Loricrin-like protein [Quillaja saponaria]|uniref:Loricrin-like protein n=1 Tax=Quillaja saponaria TaxID=32244 RepID=A0AAD7PUX3_QUISA|nr:Loricrin-like protein [Quillaja saponaria]
MDRSDTSGFCNIWIMDLNKKAVLCSHDAQCRNSENFGDTTLSLNCLGYGGSNTTSYRHAQISLAKRSSNPSDDGCRLVLGLGPTPRAECDGYYNLSFNKKKKLATELPQGMSSDCDSILQLGLSGVTNDGSSVLDCSGSTETDINISCRSSQVSFVNSFPVVPIVDEGSTSAKKSGGYMPSLLLAPRMDNANVSTETQDLLVIGTKQHLSHEAYVATDYSMDTSLGQATSAMTSDHRINNPKKCKFFGCTKGARGASGLCIGHGGGQRCQKPGCNKGAESRTAYCKAHGGGKRCQHLGCTKSAEGKTDHCIAHGGGRRCGYLGGCTKAARGKSGLCIRHGGGKRCKVDGCTRSAEGQAGLCISHGGGRRCRYQECAKGAQGSTLYCKAHGGGKRCIFAGCTKGAEGSTPLCKGHGGGKRCLFDGGVLCQAAQRVHVDELIVVLNMAEERGASSKTVAKVLKEAQISARHMAGGSDCTWGEGKCEKFARGKSGLCAAHSSLVLETNKRGLIAPGLFHGVVPVSSNAGSSFDNNHSSSVSIVSNCTDSMERPAKRLRFIPEQVLVPISMKSSAYPSFMTAQKPKEARKEYGNAIGHTSTKNSLDFNLPEGRVHGGDLMLYFGGNLKNAIADQ